MKTKKHQSFEFAFMYLWMFALMNDSFCPKIVRFNFWCQHFFKRPSLNLGKPAVRLPDWKPHMHSMKVVNIGRKQQVAEVLQ